MRCAAALLVATATLPLRAAAEPPRWSDLRPLYEELHAAPELSFRETATSALLASRLAGLGFTVTTGVGKTGVVGVLQNGPGPVVLLRTDLDALPVEEKTGLAYASRHKGVMHACGHDVHMTAFIGAAAALVADREAWHGTLVMVGQPAEEILAGAQAMLDDGLYARFPRPTVALAIHDSPDYPSGTVAVGGGPMLAASAAVDVVVHGKGGHGARPHMAIDPVLIAAKIVVNLQSLVSRETNPFDPAVVTVGSFHAGTKHNIIPDEARLQLTVRAYKDDLRDRLVKGIERIARAEAVAANAPVAPEVTVAYSSQVTRNDPRLAERAAVALRARLGAARVVAASPVTGSEDFSRFSMGGVPILMVFVGATRPVLFERAQKEGAMPPGLHSPLFAPDAEATVMTGVDVLVTLAKTFFKG